LIAAALSVHCGVVEEDAMNLRVISVAAAAAMMLASCDTVNDRTLGPAAGNARLKLITTELAYGLPGTELPNPITVQAVNGFGDAIPNVKIFWQVSQGTGAQLSAWESVGDASGLSSVRMTLGPNPGTYIVEARIEGKDDKTPFTARAAFMPVIKQVEPAASTAGDLISIRGDYFSSSKEENNVTIGGMRAEVVKADEREMLVVVPECSPTGTMAVRTRLGPIMSEPSSIRVSALNSERLQIGVGQVATFTNPATVACMRLTGAEYLVVVQNVAQRSDRVLPFQVVSLSDGPDRGLEQIDPDAAAPTVDLQAKFEARIREYERVAPRVANAAPAQPLLRTIPPAVGTNRSFNVGWFGSKSNFVTAKLRVMSERALMYVDISAADSFSDEELRAHAAMFDKSIYPTDVGAFGAPSDRDANERVILLFTPEVNRLTPVDDPGVLAGFSTACDLDTCVDSNQGELLYLMVADPEGRFGKKFTTDFVRRTTPSVIAHELTHVIHFNQRQLARATRGEEVWLAEALAHHAEDLFADAIERDGDAALAAASRRNNYVRAAMYLGNPAAAPLLSTSPIGTLEERGAGWLMINYLVQRYGPGVLTRLTSTSLSGAANVAAQTRASWTNLVSDWSIALYADRAPELASLGLDTRYTFGASNVRAFISSVTKDGLYPLKPASGGTAADFQVRSSLSPGALQFVLVKAPTELQRTNLAITAASGVRFDADGSVNIAVLRVR
jgi:hypothetical protein